MSQEKIRVFIDDEDILELVPIYLSGRRDELDLLDKAATASDFATLRDIGHKLRGSGGGFGFERISEIGGHLEAAAKVQDLRSARLEVSALRDYLERVEVFGQ